MTDIIARNAGQLGAIVRRIRKSRGLTQERRYIAGKLEMAPQRAAA